MTSDVIAFLSGRVPGGIALVLVSLGAFSIIWLIIWKGTGFWTLKRFWQIFATGWILLPCLYTFAWNYNPPPPIPTRIIIFTPAATADSWNNWRSLGFADVIRNRLMASKKPFVLQTSDYIPAINNLKSREEVVNLARLMKVRWIILVPDAANGSVRAELFRFKGKGFDTVNQVTLGSSLFWQECTEGASRIAAMLGDDTELDHWPGSPPQLPDSIFTDYYTGISLLRMNRADSAQVVFDRLRSANPEWSAPHIEFARASMENREGYSWVEVNAALVAANEVDPGNTETFIIMARHFLELRKWSEAESALKLALNENPFDPRGYYGLSKLSRSRYHDLDLQNEEELLKYALYLAPGYDAASLALAKYYRDTFHKQWSVIWLSEALVVNPSSTALLLSLSASYLEMSENEKAAEACRRILEQKPRHPQALYNLGMALLWLGNYDESIARFDSSFAIGGNADNFYYSGIAHIRLKDWDGAIKAFQTRLAYMKARDDMIAISSRDMVRLIREWKASEQQAGPVLDSLMITPG